MRELYADKGPEGMEFLNLESLFGAVLTSGRAVISNEPSSDSRRGGLPKGHPELRAFLGVPFYRGDKMIGMVGLANREGGYGADIINYLDPLLTTCSAILTPIGSSWTVRC